VYVRTRLAGIVAVALAAAFGWLVQPLWGSLALAAGVLAPLSLPERRLLGSASGGDLDERDATARDAAR
jgi:hypothetical protein